MSRASALSTRQPVGPRALAISIAALLVPASVAIFFPEMLGDYEALLWVLALVPAFLLSYYRGWRGAAAALALGMAVLALTHASLLALGRSLPDNPALLVMVAALILAALGVGWLAEKLHRDREAIEQMAFTDSLTGLPNRRHALMVLEREFAAAQRKRRLVVAIFDVDAFKAYNDAHGHAAGDAALRALGETLAAHTRKMNLSARLGGEEFLSILSEADEAGALIFVARVRSGLAQRTDMQGGPPTVSCGLAAYHPGMRDVDALLAAADAALYEAKHAGRDAVRVHRPPAESSPIIATALPVA